MASGNDFIGLNVSGTIYKTSRTTLASYPKSFFTTLLDSSIPSAKDDQGNYLIERDGEIFRHVLNYMRCGKLVVPGDFNEFLLLECEVDFFCLPKLKPEIIGLRFADGKVFYTTRKTLLREDGSFFTKMLEGDPAVPRDASGNYFIDRNVNYFHHVIEYLRRGGIFSPLQRNELEQFREEAGYFQLKELSLHIESVLLMGTIGREMREEIGERFHAIDCYFHPCSPNFTPLVAYMYANFRWDKFQTQYHIGNVVDPVFSCTVDLAEITENGEKPVTPEDVRSFFSANLHNTTQQKVGNNLIKIEYRVFADPEDY